jgi:hypothetical protein
MPCPPANVGFFQFGWFICLQRELGTSLVPFLFMNSSVQKTAVIYRFLLVWVKGNSGTLGVFRRDTELFGLLSFYAKVSTCPHLVDYFPSMLR